VERGLAILPKGALDNMHRAIFDRKEDEQS